MHRTARPTVSCFSVSLIVVLALVGSADAQDAKTCRAKTKSMGCSLESGLSALEATQRAVGAAVNAPDGGGMKCEIDTPAITPKTAKVATGDPLPCPEDEPADDSDVVIGLCQTASTQVFDKCKAVCAKLRKRDSLTGNPIPETPCFVVVDRSTVTTELSRFVERDLMSGDPYCAVQCKASIICVCDP